MKSIILLLIGFLCGNCLKFEVTQSNDLSEVSFHKDKNIEETEYKSKTIGIAQQKLMVIFIICFSLAGAFGIIGLLIGFLLFKKIKVEERKLLKIKLLREMREKKYEEKKERIEELRRRKRLEKEAETNNSTQSKGEYEELSEQPEKNSFEDNI